MEKITENTLIPISLVIILIGGVVWLTSTHLKAESNLEAVQRIEAKQDRYIQGLNKIYSELAEIKGELKRIRR